MNISEILNCLELQAFRPVIDGFTKEPTSGEDGLDDFDNDDWRVRSLAVRDLIRLGDKSCEDIVRMLSHDSPNVRTLAATALGILEAEQALDALYRLLEEGATSLDRCQAAISIGQIGHSDSIPILKKRTSEEDQRDALSQLSIALDQIQKHDGDQRSLKAAYFDLDEITFRSAGQNDAVSTFTLPDVDGGTWSTEQFSGKKIVLLWVFADWCPVCHHEFHDLITFKDEFADLGVELATVECHDVYRSQVMAGLRPKPHYWFSDRFADLSYGKRWWPHLMDFGGAVGARFGVDPLTFAVHSEWVNRPSTIVIDENGRVEFAYHGTYWGDRPSVTELIEMLSSNTFDYEHANRKRR